jgi:hypothetical protein
MQGEFINKKNHTPYEISCKCPSLDFVNFLNSSSERRFLQLNEFLRKGKKYPSFEIHYAGVCASLESSLKEITKSSFQPKTELIKNRVYGIFTHFNLECSQNTH